MDTIREPSITIEEYHDSIVMLLDISHFTSLEWVKNCSFLIALSLATIMMRLDGGWSQGSGTPLM